MKILGAIAMAAITAASACAGETAGAPQRKVIVCSTTGTDFTIPRAQSIVAAMFAGIRVGIEWKTERACPPDAIRISFSYNTDPDLSPQALAYALPYDGTHIVVFYDRVRKHCQPIRLSGVLAHVMAHEITHILQGVNRHSESGVMKAAWTLEDFNEMAFRPLPFTAFDVRLIDDGLDKRQARMASPR